MGESGPGVARPTLFTPLLDAVDTEAGPDHKVARVRDERSGSNGRCAIPVESHYRVVDVVLRQSPIRKETRLCHLREDCPRIEIDGDLRGTGLVERGARPGHVEDVHAGDTQKLASSYRSLIAAHRLGAIVSLCVPIELQVDTGPTTD